MRVLSLAGQLVLVVVGILWLLTVGWFIFSSNQWGVTILIVAGSKQPFGLHIIFAGVAAFLTLNVFNNEFVLNETLYALSITGALTLLFILAIMKIWDTLDYFQQQ